MKLLFWNQIFENVLAEKDKIFMADSIYILH